MLTKHLATWGGGSTNTQGLEGRQGRSARIVMSNEARALRELRIMHGLSMKKAGALIGVSDSYISHIENGRSDFPRGSALDKFLTVYGGIKQKSFYERVRNWKDKVSPTDELLELVSKLSEEKARFLLNITKNL